MMNKIWAFIFIVSFLFAYYNGSLSDLNNAMLQSCNSAVEFVLGLA